MPPFKLPSYAKQIHYTFKKYSHAILTWNISSPKQFKHCIKQYLHSLPLILVPSTILSSPLTYHPQYILHGRIILKGFCQCIFISISLQICIVSSLFSLCFPNSKEKNVGSPSICRSETSTPSCNLENSPLKSLPLYFIFYCNKVLYYFPESYSFL